MFNGQNKRADYAQILYYWNMNGISRSYTHIFDVDVCKEIASLKLQVENLTAIKEASVKNLNVFFVSKLCWCFLESYSRK